MTTQHIGKPVSRVDGRAKVTGAAKYAGEFSAPDLTYGYVVSSAIAKGTITKIDTSAALAVEGVLQVFTHENRPRTAWLDRSYRDDDSPGGSPFRALYDDKIVYSGQPIALVVAETFEAARYAASLVRVSYALEAHQTDLTSQLEDAREPKSGKVGYIPPKSRGNAEKALAKAATQVEAEYTMAVEHHNPMEMHASTVVWEQDGTMTVYDKTQGVQNSLAYISKIFGLSKEKVKVVSPFVGGGFGSGLRPQYQLFLAMMAAQELKRSVRVTLTRQQMFTFGHRPTTWQRLALGTDVNGKLNAIIHEAIAETSQFEDYVENTVNWSGMLYQCDNVALDHKVVPLDVYTPIDMRAPGAATGVYALECAMDELAYKLGVDPLELRLKNYAEENQFEGKPFSSKELRACYQQAADRFGWSQRNPAPRSMKQGNQLVGWGMATGMWDAQMQKASAKAELSPDGTLTVSSSTADIGTGTYTVMTQIAAETLGLQIDDVTFKLGDTSLPVAPLEGGSWTVASVGSAVKVVCEAVGEQLLKLAQNVSHSPLAKAKIDDVVFADGAIRLKSDASQAVSIVDALKQNKGESIEQEASASPSMLSNMQYAKHSHSAVFAEVTVDEDLGVIHVTRVVSAIAGGRVINPKTARSQIIGGVVWGIGMALEEETVPDHTFGRFMNHNFAEYHVPVNADIHEIEVIFVDEPDEHVNPLGAKGLGEIGIVGVAAAVANAVFHATGKRVRELPITLDKVL